MTTFRWLSRALWAPLVLTLAVSGAVEAETPRPTSPYKDPALPVAERVSDLLGRMTLNEKVGQMTQADRQFLASEDDIASYFLGSLLSGGGSTPKQNVPVAWADMYDRYQQQALGTRLGIPLIYGIDAVHGHNNLVGAVIFPHNIGLGCTRNPELVEEVARVTAVEVAATGIDWTFAPCVAVARDERWGRTYEGFGETAELAVMMGLAAVSGYQGASLAADETILACAKHFLGDGGTQGGKDRGDTVLDEAALRKIHMAGYHAAVKAGVGSIMPSFNSWNGKQMHGNAYLLTEVLRGELGFEGLLVSDWKAIDLLPGEYPQDVVDSINAGLDLVMVPDRYPEFVATLKEAVEAGKVPMSRVDDAVRRVLTAKFELGLFEKPLTDRSLLAKVGSPAHREVGRRAVRESLVLLVNQEGTLPLRKDFAHILVAGRGADDIGLQCGGWSISWQGGSGPITEGTTIYQALRTAAPASTQVTLLKAEDEPPKADVGIVVIGELPYAEWEGDRESLDLDPADVQAVRRVHEAGIPTVVVLLSGRPMILEPILPYASAVVAAWLPGSEGDGVADVLFGVHPPTGKLSHSWPCSMDQIPLNVDALGEGDESAPLFPYGFGLTYE